MDVKILEYSEFLKTKTGRPAYIEWTRKYIYSIHEAPKDKPQDKSLQRIASKSFRKVGYEVNIIAQKKLSDERIFVRLESSHNVHCVNILDAFCRPRHCPSIGSWLNKVMVTRIDWNSFKRMIGPEHHRLGFLENEVVNLGEPA